MALVSNEVTCIENETHRRLRTIEGVGSDS